MKTKHIIIAIATTLSLTACDLVSPGDTINPNVTNEEFVGSPGAMTTWTNGSRMKFASAMGYWSEMVEILSDNYFNNYTLISNVFDIPRLLNSDDDISKMQRMLGQMREMADYGLNELGKAEKANADDLFDLYTIKSFSYLLAGEYFVGLPMHNGGEIHPWEEHLKEALKMMDKAIEQTTAPDKLAFVYTLKARAYYDLGNREQAVLWAQKALAASPDFVHQVTFDGANGVKNDLQQAVWSNWYQPLPRLDFLDPKYFQLTSNEQRPLTIAKAEEDYLIIAEALVAERRLDDARAKLRELLTLVKQRPVQYKLNDQLEKRDNGVYKKYPKDATLLVQASPTDSLRHGLIIDRQKPALVDIPYISGTSVTADMIDRTKTADGLLELVYLMRQEIFFAEGRRASDLGIRLPLSEVEAAHVTDGDKYSHAFIPDFIPQNGDMDAFTVDEDKKIVTIKYNMNKIIVEHKASKYVAPFE